MQILADENIPYVTETFSHLGKVRTLPGRELCAADLGDTELLLVRSVTEVNEALLSHSQVRFVGTATIGFDHINLDFLRKHHIGFAACAGSNANSTAEYVISALLIIAQQQCFKLSDKWVGIIGCGNVGARVLQKLSALGVTCLVYDPPLQDQVEKGIIDNASLKTCLNHLTLVDLETVLTADIVTLHVPLEKKGRHATYHLMNAARLKRLKQDVVFVNTSRGQVIEENALMELLPHRPKMTLVLDVWANEPRINPSLLYRTALGTPHIAGYSFDGKVRGTEMLYHAVCRYFEKSPTWQIQSCLPPPPLTHLAFSDSVDDDSAIHTAVMACYDVRRDDANLRLLPKSPHPVKFFDNLRKHYPVRREYSCLTVEAPKSKETLRRQLGGLGFCVIEK